MALRVLIVLALLAFSVCNGFEEFFTNPVPGDWTTGRLNPYVIQINSKYYLSLYENETESISIHESSKLTDFRNASRKVVHSKLPNVALSAGPIYIIDGELYLYFCRTYQWWQFPYKKSFSYAMKAVNASDPMGEWETPVRLDSPWNIFEDGTIMKHGHKKYFIWHENDLLDYALDIYITEMITPTQSSQNRSILRGKKDCDSSWDCVSGPMPGYHSKKRFPTAIYNGNRSYLVFTGHFGPFYETQAALSYMSIAFDKDPMEIDNWDDAGGPLFSSNEEEDVFNPAYAAFVKSPDMTETWMIYTANEGINSEGRGEFRLEKIDWDDDNGSIKFPKAHGSNHPQRIPSGQASG